MKRAHFFLALFLSGCPPNIPTRGFCDDERDCSPGALCVAGRCVPSDGGAGERDAGGDDSSVVLRCGERRVAPVGSVVRLDCAALATPDGTLAWTVVERPQRSISRIKQQAAGSALFGVDAAAPEGSPYRFRCTATPPQGDPATCQAELGTMTDRGMRILLLWDRDEVDLDLHLLDATARLPGDWFDPQKDCYYLSPQPDWGVHGDGADNPILVASSDRGFGPEAIRCANCAPGRYTVGAHYFCDRRLGPARATARVFCNGIEAASFERMLCGTGVFWDVLNVTWPGCEVREIAATRSVSQGCGGPRPQACEPADGG